MEIKEFDTCLMELAYEIRKCREAAQKITQSYPNHVKIQRDVLESQMKNVDLIIGQCKSILAGSRESLDVSSAAINAEYFAKG